MDKEEEEQHSMSKPKPLEDPLTEVKKKPEFRYYMDAGGNPQQLDKMWKTWLDKKEKEKETPKKEEPEIQSVPVPKEEEEEETIVDNTKQVAGAEGAEGLLHLVGSTFPHLLLICLVLSLL